MCIRDRKISNENKMKIICLEKELDKDNGSLEILYKVSSPNAINEEMIKYSLPIYSFEPYKKLLKGFIFQPFLCLNL